MLCVQVSSVPWVCMGTRDSEGNTMMTVVFSPHLPAGRSEGKEERGREEGVHAESHELASFQTRDSLMNEWFLPFAALANAHVSCDR